MRGYPEIDMKVRETGEEAEAGDKNKELENRYKGRKEGGKEDRKGKG